MHLAQSRMKPHARLLARRALGLDSVGAETADSFGRFLRRSVFAQQTHCGRASHGASAVHDASDVPWGKTVELGPL